MPLRQNLLPPPNSTTGVSGSQPVTRQTPTLVHNLKAHPPTTQQQASPVIGAARNMETVYSAAPTRRSGTSGLPPSTVAPPNLFLTEGGHYSQPLPLTSQAGSRGGRSTNVGVPVPPVHEMTLHGEKYPVDLKPFLHQGKPLRIASIAHDTASKFYAARFPFGFDVPDLAQPVSICRDTSHIEIENAVETHRQQHAVGESLTKNRAQEARRKRISGDTIPWRLVDASSRNLVGRRLDLDASSYFVMVDKGSFMDIVPLDAWYSFQADVACGQAGPPSSDVAERKRRAALRREERAEAELLRKRLQKEGVDHEEAERILAQAGAKTRVGRSEGLEYLYAEDAGLQRQQRKRFKQFIKSKRKGIRRDDEDTGQSALNVGHIKRAAVDWDWDDDGKASDDEEGTDITNDAADGKQYQTAGPYESDDEEEEVLTKYGQQVHSALESQREQDAEDELAQFSDDEEDEDEAKKSSSAVEATESAAEGAPIRPASARPLSDNASSLKTGRSTSNVLSQEKGRVGDTSGPLSPQNRHRTSKTSPSGELDTVKKPSSGDSQRLTPEIVRQRVIRTLSLHGGRMPTKKFIQSFNITSNKSELFKLIRKTINEICEVHTEYQNGETVKILELQTQFRDL